MQSSILCEITNSLRDSMDSLRRDISDVVQGPIIDGVEYVNFKFRGESKSVPLANPDYLIVGDGRLSDQSIALRSLLSSNTSWPSEQSDTRRTSA